MTRRLWTIVGIALFLGVIAFFAYRTRVSHTQSASADVPSHSPPVLIPGIQEPEEMRVEAISLIIPSPPERMLGEAIQQAGNDKGGPAALLPALDRILAKYPDYSDGYTMRLGAFCDSGDRAAILANVNKALKYASNSRVGKDSTIELLSMRAKVEHANGDDSAAMDDLYKGIQTNLAESTQFVNSGAVEPEKSAKACTWTLPEMDALVARFTNDYRVYVVRGLYYGFFAQWNESSIGSSIDNLRKAAEMNPNSALPHFFVAHVLNRAFSIKKYGMSDSQRQDLNHLQLKELTAALTVDPNLLPAISERAEVYFELKQFSDAIPDYDKIIILNPKDSGAYNDRGLSKMQLGDVYAAISDFGNAINNKTRELQHSSSYENRADAYMKTQQWALAANDLSTAISLQIAGVVLVGNIQQFRALYPEYATASDEAVARKLNQTFYPNMKYENFSPGFLRTNKAWASTVIPDLYMKRSDAYLKGGNWHRAAIEFRRATAGFPSYADAIDRWREIGSRKNSQVYVDLKTFDDSHSDSAKLWIRESYGSGENKPYSLQQYEFNCGTRQMRTVSVANYSASGNFTGSREGGSWGSVIPDTLGEDLFNGVCPR